MKYIIILTALSILLSNNSALADTNVFDNIPAAMDYVNRKENSPAYVNTSTTQTPLRIMRFKIAQVSKQEMLEAYTKLRNTDEGSDITVNGVTFFKRKTVKIIDHPLDCQNLQIRQLNGKDLIGYYQSNITSICLIDKNFYLFGI